MKLIQNLMPSTKVKFDRLRLVKDGKLIAEELYARGFACKTGECGFMACVDGAFTIHDYPDGGALDVCEFVVRLSPEQDDVVDYDWRNPRWDEIDGVKFLKTKNGNTVIFDSFEREYGKIDERDLCEMIAATYNGIPVVVDEDALRLSTVAIVRANRPVTKEEIENFGDEIPGCNHIIVNQKGVDGYEVWQNKGQNGWKEGHYDDLADIIDRSEVGNLI